MPRLHFSAQPLRASFLARVTTVLAISFLAIGLVETLFAQSDAQTQDEAEVKTFSESAIARQFDANRDGVFSAAESSAMRRAFGGVDVPVLPDETYSYSKNKVPPRMASMLSKLDNTPPDNPIDDRGATLGRVLFYDRQLSKNNTIACASCHLQERGFADPRQFSSGFEEGKTKRNSMSLSDLRYSRIRGANPGFFWDERAPTLEAQTLMPIQDAVEMGMKLEDLERKLQRLPYYPPLFSDAFGSKRVTRDRIAKAIAQFMRSMTSFDSRFDKAAAAEDRRDYSKPFRAFTPQENLGKSLFISGINGVAEVGCAHCHMPPTFGMPKSFNNGLDLRYADRGLGERNVESNDPFTPNNDGKFKAPSLRNIELTGPYMHDGRFNNLEQVVKHYSDGVQRHPNLGLAVGEDDADSKNKSGFRLTKTQQAALVAFLKTLTDDAFLTDPRFSDPFVRAENDLASPQKR